MHKYNTKLPLVSVIIPVYNIEEYIADCLDSILKQSYNNWEAIVVNDGSTDSSLEICESFAKRDSRFKVITTKNGGSSNARNYGLDNVKGNYVMMVDGDDMLMPDAIKTSVEQISQSKVDILCTSCRLITEDGENVLRTWSQTPIARLEAMTTLKLIHSGNGIIPGIWAKIYRVELLKDIRFNLKLRMAQDIFFNTELLLANPEITVAISDIITYKYRIRKSSVSHSNPTAKIRPYIEEMSVLIPQYSGTRDAATLSLMANAAFSLMTKDIIRKPIHLRYPDEWHYRIMNRLAPYITDYRYQKLAETSSNRMKSIIDYTKLKYSRLKSRLESRAKKVISCIYSKIYSRN